MPALFNCDKCGTKSWNRTPSSAGELLSRHVMREGRFCPVCGQDFEGEKADGKSNSSSPKKPNVTSSGRKWWQFWK